MTSSPISQPRAGLALTALAALGGAVGFLAGLFLLFGAQATGQGDVWRLVAIVVVATAVAELAFAYGTATRSAWAARPAAQALGFAAAIAFLLVALVIVIVTPVRTTVEPVGQPVVVPSTASPSS
jgi:hypothetical protein